MTPSRQRAMTGGVWARSARELVAGELQRRRTGSSCPAPNRRPARASVATRGPRRSRSAIASARARSAVDGCRGHPPERHRGDDVAARGRRARAPAPPPARARRGARARASGWRAQRATRSARPAMMPACGPPSSLSPLNVTSAAPASIVWRGGRLATPATAAGAARATTGRSASSEPAAEVDDDRDAERGELADRGVLDEAVDAVVARVHLEHEGDVGARRVEGPAVVGEPRAVRRADVDEARARTAPSPPGRGSRRRSRRSRRG